MNFIFVLCMIGVIVSLLSEEYSNLIFSIPATVLLLGVNLFVYQIHMQTIEKKFSCKILEVQEDGLRYKVLTASDTIKYISLDLEEK